MAIEDEIYLKYHIGELDPLDDEVVELWKAGLERHCMREHGLSVEEYYNKFETYDGVGGYGSSGRKPLPKEYWND